MTSKIKVDNINKVSDDSNIIKKCGTTTTIGSGASNPIVVDGSAVTLGRCGGTVALASGATQTGFGRSGSVNWQTTPKTAPFTAADGEGYFVDTSSGAVTVNLPAGSAGAIVAFADYTRTFGTNALTIVPNGSNKIGGVDANAELNTSGEAATFVFVDSTEGWINVQQTETSVEGGAFIAATGGTITTVCTNFKVHTFTGPGSFCVSAGGGGKATVDYLVVAGGGSGSSGTYAGGGGGAGGYRESGGTASGCYSVSPLGSSPSPVAGIVMAPGSFPITVGGGGATRPPTGVGNAGSNSVAALSSTITSTGGGGGGWPCAATSTNGGTGGSGGGSMGYGGPFVGGAGNTPTVTPPQGNPGGAIGSYGGTSTKGGGGGGAGAVGGNASPSAPGGGGTGGDGVTTSITGSAVTRAGGGGGSTDTGCTGSRAGGSGGGGTGANGPGNSAGTCNTGGGGGGTKSGTSGAAGGSGIVVIRYKFQ